jgi:outer membrane protein assembly factor BamB
MDWLSSRRNQNERSFSELNEWLDEKPAWHLDYTKLENCSGEVVTYKGRMYVKTGDYMSGSIACLDLCSGEKVWEEKYDFGFSTDLIISDNHLYFGYLIINIESGDVEYDIRKLNLDFDDEDYGGLGVSENYLLIAKDLYDLNHGFFIVTKAQKSVIELNISTGAQSFFLINRDRLVLYSKDIVTVVDISSQDVVLQYSVAPNTEILALSYKNEHLYSLETNAVVKKINVLNGQSGALFRVKATNTECERSEPSLLLLGDDYIAVGSTIQSDSWLATISEVDVKVRGFRAFDWPSSLFSATMGGNVVYCVDESNKIIGIDCQSGNVVWTSEEDLTAKRLVIGSEHLIGCTTFGGFTIWGPKGG